MIRTYAENAVTAKVKSMYGRRLTAEHFGNLLQKKTVGEVAAYLKQETAYASVLGEIKEELIHRGQLESLVRRRSVDIYEKLLKYNFQDSFYPRLYAARGEISQLLSAMRMLNSGSMGRFIVDFPVYMDKFLSFDLFSLARIGSFDDLLEVVGHSRYYELLGPHRPLSANAHIDIPACEADLLTDYFKGALALARRIFGPGVSNDLCAILREQIDMQNLKVIYRMRRFFHASPEEIEKRLIPIKTRISHRIYNELAHAESADEVMRRLSDIRILRRHLGGGNNGLERSVESLRQHTNRRLFRFTTHPVVALMSYMILMEIEVENLTSVIEGIRYGLPADEIRQLLIL